VAQRKKKGEPEMLIVSFCDIITITTAAMFFALLITIQEASKVPLFRPAPHAIPTNKTAVFFECRDKEIFYIDKPTLNEQITKLMDGLSPGVRTGKLDIFLNAVEGRDVGDKFYRVNPRYLLDAVVALDGRPGVHGETTDQIQRPTSKFWSVVKQLDRNSHYIVFLVRDDSFDIMRRARVDVDKIGFDVGWELLEENESIKFGAHGGVVSPDG
jgi:hypothetical protein